MTEVYTQPVAINGRWTLQLPVHRAIRYMMEPQWEKERIASMCLNIDKDHVIYDIGAEEGDMTALFGTWQRDGLGKMILFEPNPKVWPCIKACFDANGIPAPAFSWVGFASDETADADIQLQEGDCGVVTGWPKSIEGEIIAGHGFRHLAEETDTTPQITIDDFSDRCGLRPNVITIDIEGAELQALRGAEETLKTERPLVWVSVHPEFMKYHFQQKPAELYKFMEELDYRMFHLGDDHETHIYFEPK